LAPEGMNAIVFGREKGRSQKALATRCASCTAIACSIILSSVKLEKRFSIAERVSSRLLTSPPYPSQRLLNSFLLEPTSRK